MTIDEYKKHGFTVFDKPKTLRIELVQGCNRNCGFCGLQFLDQSINKFKFVSDEVFYKIIDDLSSVQRIEFAQHGEPSLHPKLEEYIRAIYHKNPKTQLSMISNCDVYINKPENLYRLFYLGMNYVQLDIYDKEQKAKWTNNLKNCPIPIVDFYKGNPMYSYHKNGKAIVVCDDSETFSKGDGVAIRKFHTFGGSISHKVWPKYSDIKLSDFPMKKVCTEPLRFMTFDLEGNVMMCCRDMSKSLKICNIMDFDNIHDCWNSEELQIVRFILKAGRRDLIPGCFFCGNVSMRSGLYPYVGEKYTLEECKKFIEERSQELQTCITNNKEAWEGAKNEH